MALQKGDRPPVSPSTKGRSNPILAPPPPPPPAPAAAAAAPHVGGAPGLPQLPMLPLVLRPTRPAGWAPLHGYFWLME